MLPILLSFILLDAANAYNWHFAADPAQCQDLTVSVTGSDGKGPYSLLIVPFGSSPFSNNTEVRVIKDVKFPSDSATEVTFKMDFPENSQFVAVMSDASGFGSGGTSVAATVQSSDDSSCYDVSASVTPDYYYSIDPPNQIVQCSSTRIFWTPADVEGTPKFFGVIPGGQSFAVPEGDITEVQSKGTGFSWVPNIRGGTTLLLVGGDDRGSGSAGSSLYTVGGGTSNDNSCLNEDSPSSTPGTPAGGAYATSTSGAGTGGDGSGGSNSGSSGGSSTNVGAIVGGVIGGVCAIIALVLLIIFLRRRNRFHKQQGEKPVDLLHSDEGDERPTRGAELPQYYEPEPFIVPDPTVASDSGRGSTDGRPVSQVLSDTSGPYGGTSTNGGRKGPMRQLRPVNVIQHDDAGPSEPLVADEEPETVELPPAYTNIRK